MRTLVFVAVLLAPSLAHAERAHYTRKQPPPIPVKLSERVVPPHGPGKTEPTQPVVTSDDILEIEEDQQPIRQGQEAILVKLITDTPDTDPEKPEYMFRLAEHYAKQLRFYRLKAIAPTIPAHPR